MKRNRIWILVSVLVVLGLLLGGFGCAAPTPTPTPTPTPAKPTPTPTPTPAKPTPTPAPSPAAPETITWKGQHTFTPGPAVGNVPMSGNGTWGYQWVDWVKEATGGRLVLDLAPPGSIIPPTESFTAASQGVVDIIGPCYPAYFAGILPEANPESNVPFAVQSIAEYWTLLHYYGLADALHEIYAENNIYHIALPAGTNGIAVGGTFPITTSADFTGKKIRAAGAATAIIEALGGTPVTIPFTEVYMALKLGTVDGWLGSFSQLEDHKLKEVVSHVITSPNGGMVGHNIMINQDSWNKLPDDIKELLERDTKWVLLGGALENIAAERYMISNIPEVEFVTLSAADAAAVVQRAKDSWSKLAAANPGSKKLMDIIMAFAKDYRGI